MFSNQKHGRLLAAAALTAGMVLAAVIPGAYGQESDEAERQALVEEVAQAEETTREELERAVALLRQLNELIDREGLAEMLQATRGSLERSLAVSGERARRGMVEARAALERARQGGLVRRRAPRPPRAPQPWVHVNADGGRFFGRLHEAAGPSAERVLAHAEDLELSEDQQDRIRSIRRQHRRDEISRNAAIEVAELDLDELMQDAERADLDAVEAQMMEIARLRVEGRIADLRVRRQVEETLTAEQIEQLDESSVGGVFRLREGGPASFWLREHDHDHDEEHEEDGEAPRP